MEQDYHLALCDMQKGYVVNSRMYCVNPGFYATTQCDMLAGDWEVYV